MRGRAPLQLPQRHRQAGIFHEVVLGGGRRCRDHFQDKGSCPLFPFSSPFPTFSSIFLKPIFHAVEGCLGDSGPIQHWHVELAQVALPIGGNKLLAVWGKANGLNINALELGQDIEVDSVSKPPF